MLARFVSAQASPDKVNLPIPIPIPTVMQKDFTQQEAQEFGDMLAKSQVCIVLILFITFGLFALIGVTIFSFFYIYLANCSTSDWLRSCLCDCVWRSDASSARASGAALCGRASHRIVARRRPLSRSGERRTTCCVARRCRRGNCTSTPTCRTTGRLLKN